MDGPNGMNLIVSASDFIDRLFEEQLESSGEYDAEVVRLVRKHLGQASVHSQAGVRLAEALVQLAKDRAKGGDDDLGSGENQHSGGERST
jgi:hypothetical protein